MRILFMGTPDFAVPSLMALLDNNYDVVGVVTQADRPKGRGHTLTAPPVKECAVLNSIPVYQPERLSKEPHTVQALNQLNPDIIVTCAFGQLLPQSVLDIPKLGTVNVHGSLLPKYRGAAPIQRAIIDGEAKTGITTMFTDIGLDTGDMLLKEEIEIPADMTAGELHDKMSYLGADVLIKTLKAIETGTINRIKQDDSQATHAPKVDKETGCIAWNMSSNKIHNLIRGTSPWPGAYTELNGKKLKIWRSKLCEAYTLNNSGDTLNIEPATIVSVDTEGMLVKTGDGLIYITEIQVDSSKRMTPSQYACGHELKKGMILGG